MAKPKVKLDGEGKIEKYIFPDFRNSLTPRDPFTIHTHIGAHGLVDCVVVDLDGKHIRDAVLDSRGNVGDFEGSFVPVDELDLGDLGRPKIPHANVIGPRLTVGYGIYFGEGVLIERIDELPESPVNLCSIGSYCVIESGVQLTTDRHFRIDNRCVIGANSRLKGRVIMESNSRVGASTAVGSLADLHVGQGAMIGNNARVMGAVQIGEFAKVGDRFWVKSNRGIHVPACSIVPDGFVPDMHEDMSSFLPY